MPASLAKAYQVSPFAIRAARIRAGKPAGEVAMSAALAGGNSFMTLARISAWRARSSAVADRTIRLNDFLATILLNFLGLCRANHVRRAGTPAVSTKVVQ
jgi:hypothetical protein